MVKIKEESYVLADNSIHLDAWLRHLEQSNHYPDLSLIRNAALLSRLAGQEQATESGASCLQQGLAMAEMLVDLEVDQETIAAAILYDSVQYTELTIEDINEQLGHPVAHLIEGVERMDAITLMRNLNASHAPRQQIDNIRKMLLSMVDDLRVVLIKLSERLHVLRTLTTVNASMQKKTAREIMEIYVPLANRLGIGQIKWEMEDLAFRYLDPSQYKTIAKSLNSRRIDRDRYANNIVDTLYQSLEKSHIKDIEISGRSKHIHSIHRKMLRKNLPLQSIYDTTAVRVLASSIDDCYRVLSVVHELWPRIAAEFDDYIANPKGNGYRSLHTAVIGPEDKHFEVQIRTHEMHRESELGVAAHWCYKEGRSTQHDAYDRKIAWLREVLAWQKELTQGSEISQELAHEVFDERIYIFTPKGDILDLPQGSTPLDFAYHIHSQVGHRCRGAKINDHIVPLTYQLKMGDRVDILTSKEARPSRDWLNPNLAYLKSSRAKSKVLHWFKEQDYGKNRDDGAAFLEREIRKLNIKKINHDKLAKQLHFKKFDDMLVALARGELRITQVMAQLSPIENLVKPTKIHKIAQKPPSTTSKQNISVDGVENLLSHLAGCCHPLPGNAIIGYITLSHGISIHRQDCPNVQQVEQPERLINVSWGGQQHLRYPIDIVIECIDSPGLLNSITQLLKERSINIIALHTDTLDDPEHVNFTLTLEIDKVTTLSEILDKLRALPKILEARRIS